MKSAASFFYSLILSLWVGGMAIFTFLVTPAIFRAFPRDHAGAVVDVLFPVYFPYTLALSVLALAFFVVSGAETARTTKIAMALLAAAIAANLYLTFSLYPKIQTIKRSVVSFEHAPDAPARQQFRQMHAISAVLNLLLIVDGTVLLIMNTSKRKKEE